MRSASVRAGNGSRSSHRFVAFLVATLGFAYLAVVGLAQTASTVVLVPTRDATLVERPLGNKANGGGKHFFVGRNANEGRRRALLQFDIASAIPAGSLIESATLTLRLSRTNAGNRLVTLHRCLAPWTEGASRPTGGEGKGADSLEDDVTWIHTSYPDVFWSQPGGDFVVAPIVTAAIQGPNYYELTSSLLPAEIQGWLDGTVPNHGWMLVGEESHEDVSAKRFDTRQNNTPANRPTLTVTYAPPTENPCLAGTVDLGSGVASDVLFVNGTAGDSARTVTMTVGEPLTLTMAKPPAGPSEARFVLYLNAGIPSDDAIYPQPANIGSMCFGSPLDGASPRKIWNNIGHQGELGKPDYPSVPAPCTVVDAPEGADRRAIVTLQGIIFDRGSAGDVPASVTNAVTIVVD